jgi:hypothetical protein
VISFTSTSFRQNEDGTLSANVITLERVGGSGAVSVTISFPGGTATGGVDYDNTPIVVSWPAGDTSNMVVTVPVIDDNNDEQPFETVDLVLGSPTGGAVIGLGTATLDINDEDIAGVLEFDNASYLYFEDGTPIVAITVIRTGGMDGDVSVTVTSSDATANSDPLSLVEPVDYTPISTSAFFADQSTTSVVITVALVNDVLPEITEAFNVALSNPTNGADLGVNTTASVQILDNDLFLEVENPSAVVNGFFGSSVAKIGPRLAVGAPGNSAGAGRVFAVNLDSDTVHDTLDGGALSQGFGTSLASSGSTLGIGGNGGAWSFGGDVLLDNYSERFSVSSLDAGFGAAVLVHLGRLVVGAPDAQIGGSLEPSGRIHSFDEFSGTPFPTEDGVGGMRMGAAFAARQSQVLFGAPGLDGLVGALGGFPWTVQGVVNNPFPQLPSNAFGTSIAVDPFNGNIYVGTPDADTFAPDDGRVHVFDGVSPGTILSPGPALANGRFGASLLTLSDGRLCVQQAGGASGVGRIYVFTSGGGLVGVIDSPAPSANQNFGASMAEFDDVLAVGAPGDPALLQSGSVFIVKLP